MFQIEFSEPEIIGPVEYVKHDETEGKKNTAVGIDDLGQRSLDVSHPDVWWGCLPVEVVFGVRVTYLLPQVRVGDH